MIAKQCHNKNLSSRYLALKTIAHYIYLHLIIMVIKDIFTKVDHLVYLLLFMVKNGTFLTLSLRKRLQIMMQVAGDQRGKTIGWGVVLSFCPSSARFLLTVINFCGYFIPLTIVDTLMKQLPFFFAFFFTFR